MTRKVEILQDGKWVPVQEYRVHGDRSLSWWQTSGMITRGTSRHVEEENWRFVEHRDGKTA